MSYEQRDLAKKVELIKEAGKIIKANHIIKKQYDIGFNIFSTLNIERDEVFTHYKHNKTFNECNEALVTILGSIKRKGSGSLLYEYILDSNGRNYDFKHFSDNCVELNDSYVKEAKRIADMIIDLKKAVENQLLK